MSKVITYLLNDLKLRLIDNSKALTTVLENFSWISLPKPKNAPFFLKGYRLGLKAKNCGKSNCQTCPHNLVWAKYSVKVSKQEKRKYFLEKEYNIGSLPWQLKKTISKENQQVIQETEKKIKRIIKQRDMIVSLQRQVMALKNNYKRLEEENNG